jgi:hypothetical protein
MKSSTPLLLLLTICLAAIAALGVRAYVASESPAQATSERGPVRMIRFVLMPDGLYPRQMHVDQGLLNIALEDKTSGSEGLVIESVIGDSRTRVTQIARAEKHWRGRTLVRLVPGRYVVSDASRPDNKAELVVNP